MMFHLTFIFVPFMLPDVKPCYTSFQDFGALTSGNIKDGKKYETTLIFTCIFL